MKPRIAEAGKSLSIFVLHIQLEEGFYWSVDETAVNSVYAMGVSFPDEAISKLLNSKHYN